MHWLRHFEDQHGPVVAALTRDLARVEERFQQQLRSDLPCVERLCEQLEQYRGKMLRPTMTLLAGLAGRGGRLESPLDDALITVAAVTEMVHVATLVHDDVLDEAEMRRQSQTLNKLHGNEEAVILGDYLISSAFEMCSELQDQRTALRIGRVTTRVCGGELLQLERRGDYSLDEQTYYEIIERKTASLIGVACELGAAGAGADERVQRRMRDFGVQVGVAFQIQDDLLDLLGEERIVGKSLGKDLEKGKLTLPVIHHLASLPADRRSQARAMLDALRFGADETETAINEGRDGAATATLAEARSDIRAALDSTGSVEFATAAARRAVDQAREAIRALPDSPARRLMDDLAEAVLDRRY